MSVLTTDRVSVRGPAHFIQNDTRTQVVWFTVNRYRDGIDLAGLSWSIHILNAAGIPDVAVPFEHPDVRGDKIIIGWLVRGTATAAAGDLTFNLRGVGEDENGNALRWSGGDEKRPVYTAQESEPSDEQEAALSELDALIEYVGSQLPGVISAGKEARAAANVANASAEAASNAGTAAASAASAANEATANAKNLPYIGENGNWYLWDTKTGAYVDSGKPSRGEGSEGGGGINEETDPTVPNWAKAPNKPSYTAAEVGALPATYVPPDQTAAQVGADPAGTASNAVSTHNTSGTAHNDIRLELSTLAARINAALNSDDVNLDQMAEIVAYIKSNKSLIDAVTTGKVSVSDIVNNLTTNTANKPLSAAQGVALKKLIDAITVPTKLSELAEDATHRLTTDDEKAAWNGKLNATALPEAINTALAQAKASGEFDGAPGYTPVKDKDYFDGKDGASPTVAVADITGGHRITITDKNGTKTVDVMDGAKGDPGDTPARGKDYWTLADQEQIVQDVITALGTPVFGRVDANKVITLTGTLADGTYIFQYEDEDGNAHPLGSYTKAPAPSYTNVLPISIGDDGAVFNGTGYIDGYRLSSNYNTTAPHYVSAQSGYFTTGFLPYDIEDCGNRIPFYVKGVDLDTISDYARMAMYTDHAAAYNSAHTANLNSTGTAGFEITKLGEQYYRITPGSGLYNTGGTSSGWGAKNATVARLSLPGSGAGVIITINEPIE